MADHTHYNGVQTVTAIDTPPLVRFSFSTLQATVLHWWYW